MNDILHHAYTAVAAESMKETAEEAKSTPSETGVKDVTASFDGAWQRRGYASLNGVASGIVDGKVVDYAMMCKVCPSLGVTKEHTCIR